MGLFYYVLCDACKEYLWIEKLHPNRQEALKNFMAYRHLSHPCRVEHEETFEPWNTPYQEITFDKDDEDKKPIFKDYCSRKEDQ